MTSLALNNWAQSNMMVHSLLLQSRVTKAHQTFVFFVFSNLCVLCVLFSVDLLQISLKILAYHLRFQIVVILVRL